MPLRLKQHGYQVLLDQKRQDQGLRKLFELCGVYEGTRVLVTPNGEAEALYEVAPRLCIQNIQIDPRQRHPALKSGHQAKIFQTRRPGKHSVVCKNHKRP